MSYFLMYVCFYVDPRLQIPVIVSQVLVSLKRGRREREKERDYLGIYELFSVWCMNITLVQ